VAVTIIKELAKQAEHHVTHDACFLEAYMPDVTPLVTTNNGDFYTQNALLTLPESRSFLTHPLTIPVRWTPGTIAPVQGPHISLHVQKQQGVALVRESTRVRAQPAALTVNKN